MAERIQDVRAAEGTRDERRQLDETFNMDAPATQTFEDDIEEMSSSNEGTKDVPGLEGRPATLVRRTPMATMTERKMVEMVETEQSKELDKNKHVNRK